MKPVYTDIATEYDALRNGTGLVDYLGAGLFLVSGPGAPAFLGSVATRNVDFLLEGQISTALLLRPDGSVLAELLLHCRGTDYLVEVWPAQREVAAAYLSAAAADLDNVTFTDLGDSWSVFGLEGPSSPRIAQQFLDFSVASMAYRSFADVPWGEDGAQLLISRTGVTGEFGYKIHVPGGQAESVRAAVLAAGAVEVGKDAVDICRMEMRFANLEFELDGNLSTPFDIGLEWMVDFGHDFVGKGALLDKINAGLAQLPVCWLADSADFDLPAVGTTVTAGGVAVGEVVYAMRSPSLDRVVGTARVDNAVAASGLSFAVGAGDVTTVSAPFLVATSFGIPLE